MTTATATPNWRVTRSSLDTRPGTGSSGPDRAVSGLGFGLTTLVPLPAGWPWWGRRSI